MARLNRGQRGFANLLKIVEAVAASTIVFTALGYFSGFAIFTSFLERIVGAGLTVGFLLPNPTVIAIGFILLVSFILVFPLVIVLAIEQKGNLIESIITTGIILKIAEVSHSLTVGGLTISRPVIIGIFIIIIFSLNMSVHLIFRLVEKSRKLRVVRRFFSEVIAGYPKILILGLVPFLIPFFSLAIQYLFHFEHGLSSINNPLFILSNFYAEYIFTLVIAVLITRLIVQEIQDNKKDKIFRVFATYLLCTIYLMCIYEFSTVIGWSIANSYALDKKGIFPESSFYFKDIQEDNKKKFALISKDDSNFYFLDVYNKKIVVYKQSDVVQLEIPARE